MGELTAALRRAMELAGDDPARAVEELERALENARGRVDPREISAVARHAAVICESLGDFGRAIRYYEEAIAGDPEAALLHLAIGGVHAQRQAPDRARKNYRRCLSLAESAGDHDLAAVASGAIKRLDGAS